MLIALLILAAMAEWVPARWSSADPASLELVRGTPINCLLLERAHWSRNFNETAKEDGIATLGVIRRGEDAAGAPAEAQAAGFTGIVLEGSFDDSSRAGLRRRAKAAGLAVVELPPRIKMNLHSDAPILGTCQGLWPGIHTLEDGTAKAAPTGAPWIETNTGFLRFVRASSSATVWMGNYPPEGRVIPLAQYFQAIGDAAMVGARWIVALDKDFNRRLLEGEPKARAAFGQITTHLKFWEDHRGWSLLRPRGELAIVEDVASGALLSNGIVDMLTARHTPLRVIPSEKLSAETLAGARMALDINPAALSPKQRELLKQVARAGGTLLTAPPGWSFPPQRKDQVTVDEKDVEKLDDIWRAVNSIVGRQNLGVRLFNVASLRSELVSAAGGNPTVLHLVNYSDYPVENVTVRLRDKFQKARLYAPGQPVQDLKIYENGEIDLDRIGACAMLVLE